eukprot:6021591-Prorocentrum_lima.AAC.1
MTSSLVGSEMCIRDSNNFRPPPQGPAQQVGPEVTSEEQEKQKEESESVSYTHLTLPTICSV